MAAETLEHKATANGLNPHYNPREDALDAIAEHLKEDDSAYVEGDEANRQALRIIEAIERRGLQICEPRLQRQETLAEAAGIVREIGAAFPQRMALCMEITNQIVALMDDPQ